MSASDPAGQGSEGKVRLRPLRRFAAAATALVAILAILYLALGPRTQELLAWVEGLGWMAPPLFVLLHTVAIVVLLPGVLFPVAAGFFFGPVYGTALSVLGKTLGAIVAFSIGRRMMAVGIVRGRARAAIGASTRLRSILIDLPSGGWRMVALVRLVPLLPFKLSNYLFGWTRFSLRDFTIGTLLGTIPYSATNALLGWAAAARSRGDLAQLTDPSSDGAVLELWMAVIVAATASLAALAIGRRALAALRKSSRADPAQDDAKEQGS